MSGRAVDGSEFTGGIVSRVLLGSRPGEAVTIQTLVVCGCELQPLVGADAHGGLELGPPLQLYAGPAARDGEPAAARRPYEAELLVYPTWDPYSSAVYMREGGAVVRLASDNTVTVVAGAVEEAADADDMVAQFGEVFNLVSDGAGSLFAVDGRHVRKLQLPGGRPGPATAQSSVQPSAAAAGGEPAAAVAAAANGPGGGPPDGEGEGEVLVSTLPFRAPADIASLAFDGGGSSGSLLFSTRTALYRLPLGDPTSAPLLLAGEEGVASTAADGRGADARFYSIWGIALDGEGSVYAADWTGGNTTNLRLVAADGTVTTAVAGLAGSLGIPAILPNGCLALDDFNGVTLHVLGLGLKLPRWHAAAAPLPPAVPAGPPPRTLPADLRALLGRQPDGTADLAIVVGGRTFHAHRVLLSAHSEYFQQHFGGDIADGSTQQLSLPDADGDAFQIVLGWVYTGTADIPAALAAGVAELADRLLLPELREQAVAVVEASVSAVTVAGLLLWAEARGPAFSALLSWLKAWYVDNHEAVEQDAEADVKLLMVRSPDLFFELVRDSRLRPAKRPCTG
ncbi:ARM REPEAT PROTEIN INTERACTING WITH ABF2 [Tetrabaena socialis]|uniref:ARM REPEAT PROTEIN INTERACTING WITH ABF2 n=1 Tax=Tetrabaena socialis TaxID=47790 RepID=A0A2J7ZUJ8_9CHLO|nr:ARM REPEAT PROTEIN INTERACTING WITH ABF2 [Tetrabaena socialis]|eukprot:PNH03910.1 ARM REPEAT PROTEIN INTERACTING WITH ABF2 [Tetrabaena socialis]